MEYNNNKHIIWLLLIFETYFFGNILCENNTNVTDVNSEKRFFVPCLTPNGKDGLCTELQQCPLLMKAFYEGKSNNFILASKCGQSDDTIVSFRVCCGVKEDVVERNTKKEEIKPEKVKCPKTPYVDKTNIKSPLPAKCGKQIMIFNRIVGGEDAGLGEYPWMARLLYKNTIGVLRFGCAGFLIHKKVVLTAAHCIKSAFAAYHGPLDTIELGEHDTQNRIDCEADKCAPAPIRTKISYSVVHSGYDKMSKSHEHDIALIFLKNRVQFTEYVRPICLLDRCINSQHLYITGWGSTSTETSTTVKLKATVPRVSNEACQNIYSKLNKTISTYQTCAGTVGKDSCKGDSGGPLMVIGSKGKWYAEGIVSYGIGCGNDYPGVYTFIPKYYDWIVNEINYNERSQEIRSN